MDNEIIIRPKFLIEETIKAHLKFYYNSWGFKRMVIYLIIFSAILTFNMYNQKNADYLLIIAPFAMIAILVISYITIKKRTRTSLLKNPRIKEDVIFTFNKESFIEEGDTFKVNHLWSEYEKIKETKDYFFLYLNKRSAILLKKEEFEHKIDDFKELMRTIPIETDFKSA